MTLDIVVIQPLVALIAGILILLVPRLLKLRRRDLPDRDRRYRLVAALIISRSALSRAALIRRS
jgi:hypothetical protein